MDAMKPQVNGLYKGHTSILDSMPPQAKQPGVNSPSSPKDTVTLGGQSNPGIMDPRQLRQLVGSGSAAPSTGSSPLSSAQAATALKSAHGDKAALEKLSDQTYNRVQELSKGLPPEAKAKIERDYKFVLQTASRAGADQVLGTVQKEMAQKIKDNVMQELQTGWKEGKLAQPKTQEEFDSQAVPATRQKFGSVVALQKDEHGWMAEMISMRHNGTGEMKELADTYLKARGELNQMRNLTTILNSDMTLKP